MNSGLDRDFGPCQTGVCRTVDKNVLGTTPLGVACAGTDSTVLDITDMYHSRN